MFFPSVWELEIFYAPKDVIVAGAGFAGLWSAYYLKKLNPALKILLIEKEAVPTGASSRNAGFACFGSFTELLNDVKSAGLDNMLDLVSRRYEGIKRITTIFSAAAINYEQYGGYELITREQYASKTTIADDIQWLNERLHGIMGHPAVFRLANDKISRFNFQHTEHLVETAMEGQLHPGKLMHALRSELLSMGVLIQNGIELTGYEQTGSKLSVHTGSTVPLVTSQLLICTNTSVKGLVPGTTIIPARGQVLVTSPIPGLAFKGTFHYDDGFYYFRDLGDRVLLGGARNKFLEEEQTTSLNVSENIQLELERFLQEVVLPNHTYTIEHRWSGIMGMAAGKIPVIREISPNCFCVTGLGGIGVALAPVAGEQVAGMMTRG